MQSRLTYSSPPPPPSPPPHRCRPPPCVFLSASVAPWFSAASSLPRSTSSCSSPRRTWPHWESRPTASVQRCPPPSPPPAPPTLKVFTPHTSTKVTWIKSYGQKNPVFICTAEVLFNYSSFQLKIPGAAAQVLITADWSDRCFNKRLTTTCNSLYFVKTNKSGCSTCITVLPHVAAKVGFFFHI